MIRTAKMSTQDLSARQREVPTSWGITVPAALQHYPQAAAEPVPYHEAIRGLMTREMNEPELFKHFFG